MAAFSSAEPNYSFYALGLYYVLVMLPRAYGVIRIYIANNGNFDNANPRGSAFNESLGKTVDKKTRAVFERATAAHQNGFENFTLFATAVICANLAKVDLDTLNTVCAIFLVLRTFYNVLYIFVDTRRLAWSRSAVWAASAFCSLYLLAKAGRIAASGEVV